MDSAGWVTPHIREIRVYPIKSLDPVAVTSAEVLPTGALAHDRRWYLADAQGRAVSAKTEPGLQRIRADFDLAAGSVRLWSGPEETSETFTLEDGAGLADWVSALLDRPLQWVEAPVGGWPDDREASGPTVISEATLETVAGWFPGMGVEEARRRFRATIEIAGVPAFWEDRLVGAGEGRGRRFTMGALRWFGLKPCPRCPVPTRDSRSGTPDGSFAKRFAAMREATLPAWAPPAQFTHFYRLAVNTVPDGAVPAGRRLRVGDPVGLD